MKATKFIKKYSKVIFVIYLLLLILVLVLKFPSPLFYQLVDHFKNGTEIYNEPPHLKPFEVITEYVSNVHSVNDWFFQNLACNILMFMPFGIIFPLLLKRATWYKVIPAGIATSALIEIFQMVTKMGTFDVDDIILNMTGLVIGYGLYKLVKYWLDSPLL